MPRPAPSVAAAAFVSSRHFTEHLRKVEDALHHLTWEVVDYDDDYSRVRVYSWPRPAHIERWFDLPAEEVLLDGTPDPGHARRRENYRYWVESDLIEEFLDLPLHSFWHEQYPTHMGDPERGVPARHTPYRDEFMPIVVAEIRKQLSENVVLAGKCDDLYTLLTSPEVKAKSDERRRSHAMSNLERGVSRFQELGWDEERIVAEVRRIFAE